MKVTYRRNYGSYSCFDTPKGPQFINMQTVKHFKLMHGVIYFSFGNNEDIFFGLEEEEFERFLADLVPFNQSEEC